MTFGVGSGTIGDVIRVEFKLWNGSSHAGLDPFLDEHLKQSTQLATVFATDGSNERLVEELKFSS